MLPTVLPATAVHNIFPSNDPRSTVNAANLPKTCGNCHAGAGDHFVIGPVHVQTATGAAHPVVKWIRWTYWVLIPLTLGFMIVHNLLDFLSKLIRRQPRHESGGQVSRMNRNFRIAHWGVILSFPTLVFTGFALKYPEAWWARPLLLWEGHFAFRGFGASCRGGCADRFHDLPRNSSRNESARSLVPESHAARD